MTKDEALRLALEALELANYKVADYCNGYTIEEVDEAITAIKDALEVNEFNPDWDTQAVLVEEIQRMAKRIEELEAKDEPVAWRDAAIRLGEELSSVGPDGYYDMDAKEWLDWAMEQNPRGNHSLPQRTWVGLTEEEVLEEEEEIMHRHGKHINQTTGILMDFVRAIEAKLKEKNT